jgi:uncharacterized protein YicC (UPF0701 family)
MQHMSVTSMTGFARVEGHTGANRWAWEIKTVNSKSLDVRFRLPPLPAAPARSACR